MKTEVDLNLGFWRSGAQAWVSRHAEQGDDSSYKSYWVSLQQLVEGAI